MEDFAGQGLEITPVGVKAVLPEVKEDQQSFKLLGRN
jgi:hypothetical protein